jgi:DNA excision repair protein ERCC-6
VKIRYAKPCTYHIYFSATQEDESREDIDSDTENNDNILNSLFEMTGIQSAIQHDQIVDGADQEKMIVDREGDIICFS